MKANGLKDVLRSALAYGLGIAMVLIPLLAFPEAYHWLVATDTGFVVQLLVWGGICMLALWIMQKMHPNQTPREVIADNIATAKRLPLSYAALYLVGRPITCGMEWLCLQFTLGLLKYAPPLGAAWMAITHPFVALYRKDNAESERRIQELLEKYDAAHGK